MNQLPPPRIITEPLIDLQVEDLELGTGTTAADGMQLSVKYYGTLARTGTPFDDNLSSLDPFVFILGQHQVIIGWDEGLAGMQVGGTRRLAVPAAKAYGPYSPSPAIPPESDLVFVVALLDARKPGAKK